MLYLICNESSDRAFHLAGIANDTWYLQPKYWEENFCSKASLASACQSESLDKQVALFAQAKFELTSFLMNCIC